MNDMAQTIVPKSDQLNADDLIAGPRTITVTGVSIKAGGEQPISIHYEGDEGKPYKACKSMCRVMVTAWGADSKKYVGRSMTLYRDPTVKWGGMEVGGIRISHMSDIDSKITMALTMTRASKKPYTVRPLEAGASKTAAPKEPVDDLTASKVPSPVETSSAAAAIDPDEAELLKEVGRRCDEGKFELAFDLARGIKNETKLAKVNARIKALQEAV
jgi:hypothetical protein